MRKILMLYGTRPEAIKTAAVNPYGDGHAAERIAGILAGEKTDPFSPEGSDIRKFLCNP